MTCSHDFKRSHPRRMTVDRIGRTWFVTLLKCRHCGYRDFEYQCFDLREPGAKPEPGQHRLTPRERRSIMQDICTNANLRV
jgi:hypothetical protein